MSRETQDSLPSEPTELGGMRFRFGVRHLLITTSLLAFFFAVLFAFPGWLTSSVVISYSTIAAAGFIAGVAYGRNNIRAFCIGALFPTLLISFPTYILFGVVTFEGFRNNYDDIFDELDDGASGMRFVAVAAIVLTPLAGAVSMYVKRFLMRKSLR